MVADVPLGALLSGGIDSSLVVALMSRLSDRPVKTFSIGFDDKDFNELPYARAVAERYGTEHHELVVRPNALEVLPTLVRHYGEPFADSSAVPSYYVSRLTREHVTVALNGDGGDESFAGYERYYASGLAETYRKIPGPLRSGVIEPLAALIPGSLPGRNRLGRAKRFLEAVAQPAGRRYLRWVGYFTPDQKDDLYAKEFRAALAGRDAGAWLLGLIEGAGGFDPLDALLATDVQSYLPYDLLVKMDIAAMATSLEARSPFFDHELMEFAARLPVRLKLRGRRSKYLLREVARDLLPAANLSRRKMGFGIPVGEWLRGELRPLLDDVLLSPRSLARGLFRCGGSSASTPNGPGTTPTASGPCCGSNCGTESSSIRFSSDRLGRRTARRSRTPMGSTPSPLNWPAARMARSAPRTARPGIGETVSPTCRTSLSERLQGTVDVERKQTIEDGGNLCSRSTIGSS